MSRRERGRRGRSRREYEARRRRGRRGRRHRHYASEANGSSQSLPSGIPQERVTQIQRALIKAGYLDGDPSGQYDADTTQAMKDFQSANHFPATGLPSAPALKKLGVEKDSGDGYEVPIKKAVDSDLRPIAPPAAPNASPANRADSEKKGAATSRSTRAGSPATSPATTNAPGSSSSNSLKPATTKPATVETRPRTVTPAPEKEGKPPKL